MDLTPAFTRTQGQQKNSLEGQVFSEASFKGSKGEVPGYAPPALGSVSMETGDILIFADIDGNIAQLVSND